MYCPRCGQQQVSDEMRYCSRCGLPLIGLTQWVTTAGTVARKRQKTPASIQSPRRRLMRRGAKLMFVSGVLFILCFFFAIAIEEGAPLIVPAILFFISLVIMLYARLFSDPTPAQAQTSALGSRANENVLPPASNLPTYDAVAQKVRTKELAGPPSVTENTTKLLDSD